MKSGKAFRQRKLADLWLIDIDGTVAPHLTVGLANKIFLSYFSRLFNREYKFNKILRTRDSFKIILSFSNLRKIKSKSKLKTLNVLLSLSYFGTKLYTIRLYNNFINLFRGYIDNTFLINTFVSMIKKNKINPDDYSFSVEELENSLYPGIKEFLKDKKVVAMSQSFCFNGGVELYKRIFGLKELYCNSFDKIKISTSVDKKKYCLKAIKKYNPKKIGVLANDYIDIDMIKLADFCILNNAPKKFRKFGDILVKGDYRKL